MYFFLLLGPEHEVNHYDFHIVYSASYRVPVLYFRSYRSGMFTFLSMEFMYDKNLVGCTIVNYVLKQFLKPSPPYGCFIRKLVA